MKYETLSLTESKHIFQRTVDLTAEPFQIQAQIVEILQGIGYPGARPTTVCLLSPWNDEQGYIYVDDEELPELDSEDIVVTMHTSFTFKGVLEYNSDAKVALRLWEKLEAAVGL